MEIHLSSKHFKQTFMKHFLLDAQSDSATIILPIIGFIIGFIILFYITRFCFMVQTSLRNQRAIIYLLKKQWEKSGVSEEEVKKFEEQFTTKQSTEGFA